MSRDEATNNEMENFKQIKPYQRTIKRVTIQLTELD